MAGQPAGLRELDRAGAGALIGTDAGMATGAALAGSITATTGAVVAGGSELVNCGYWRSWCRSYICG